MIRWREGRVIALLRHWDGAVELEVELAADAHCRALAYPRLTGDPRLGDRVLLNVTAVQLGLGTGGYALVVAIPDRLPPDPPSGPGHGGDSSPGRSFWSLTQCTVRGGDVGSLMPSCYPHSRVGRTAARPSRMNG